jgi:hypothetical protein
VCKIALRAWQRAQPRGAILRTRWAANRAVAHPTPEVRAYSVVRDIAAILPAVDILTKSFSGEGESGIVIQ